MSKLKNNIDSISNDTENIVKDYQKLMIIRITERLSLFIGILFTVFILLTLLLVVDVILSFGLALHLNTLLSSEFWGFMIVAGLYLLVIVFLILRMMRTETPLLSNLFVKLMVFVLDIDVKQSKNVEGLKQEKENINEKLDLNKEKLKSDFQLLKYSLLDGLMKELLGLFARKKKTTKTSTKTSTKTRSRTASKTNPETPKPKKRARKKE